MDKVDTIPKLAIANSRLTPIIKTITKRRAKKRRMCESRLGQAHRHWLRWRRTKWTRKAVSHDASLSKRPPSNDRAALSKW